MAIYGGWAGKVLHVDLSTGRIWTEDTLERYRDYLGGTGIGYRVMWDEVPEGTGPHDPEQLRRICSGALKLAPGGLPRTLGALPHMALELTFQGGILHWLFPPDVRNTVQDLEREQDNPHLLEALRRVLPGLARMAITFSADNQPRPEDLLRSNPEFQRLMADTGGEVVEIRRAEA